MKYILIEDIKDQFDELLKNYPHIRFIDNESYNSSNNNSSNNISSLYIAKDSISNCYICETDLFINNQNAITKYRYSTNYLSVLVHETEVWCFFKKDGYISKTQID